MTVDEAVLATAAAMDAALVTNDADTIAAFMTDDWVYVGPTGPTPRLRAAWRTLALRPEPETPGGVVTE